MKLLSLYDLMKLTQKGELSLSSSKISFSLTTYFCILLLITLAFDMHFRANSFDLSGFVTRKTVPNCPYPSLLIY